MLEVCLYFYCDASLHMYISLSLSLSLQHLATIEAANAKAREKERVPLFNVYPELMVPPKKLVFA